MLEENQKVVEKTRTEFNKNLKVSFKKILKSLLGEYVLNGTFEMNLQKFFLINLHFVLNLVGNLLLVILVWSCFLSQIEKDIFENLKDSTPINSNMGKEKWDALRGLADDRSIVINKADKGSRVVVWCRDDYIKEAEISWRITLLIRMWILKKRYFQI